MNLPARLRCVAESPFTDQACAGASVRSGDCALGTPRLGVRSSFPVMKQSYADVLGKSFHELPIMVEWTLPDGSKEETKPNLQVLKAYIDMNFFQSQLEGYSATWCSNTYSAWGVTIPVDRNIKISWRLMKLIGDAGVRLNMVCGTLVHEMVHARLNLEGHARNDDNTYHGSLYEDALAEVTAAIESRGHKTWCIHLSDPSVAWIEREHMRPIYWQCVHCKGIRGGLQQAEH